MPIPNHKRCTRCEATQPAEAFRQYTQTNGRAYLASQCKPCQTASNREYRATPAGKASRAAAKREYLSTPEGRAANLAAVRRYLAKSENRAKHNEQKRRAHSGLRARLTAILDHFEGRRGWEWIVAGILTQHPQAHALQMNSVRFEHMAAWYVGDEDQPYVTSRPEPSPKHLDQRLIVQLLAIQGPQGGHERPLGMSTVGGPATLPQGFLIGV